MKEKTDEQRERDNQRWSAIERSMTNIPPTAEQVRRIEIVRVAAKDLASVVIDLIHDSRERAVALTQLEDATMWAVKAIVLEEP